jgi:hypothetical protein
MVVPHGGVAMSSPARGPGLPYEGSSGLCRPPAGAVGLSAMRALPSGAARQYTAVEYERGWTGVEHFIRTLRAVGYVKPSSAEDCYAVLDVLDKDGDIIGDYAIPTSKAFAFVKRKLKLRVVDVEAEVERHRREQASSGTRGSHGSDQQEGGTNR